MATSAVEELRARLAEVVGGALGHEVEVRGLRRLSGGASRETWAFDAAGPGGATLELILRRDPPGAPKGGMGLEARLIAAAGEAGVVVPRTLTSSDDPAVLGSSFLVMERVEGEAIARKVLRDEAFAAARPVLAAQCAASMAKLHAVDPSTIEGLDAPDPVLRWRQTLDELQEPHPAFELGLRWLEANRPALGRQVVVHGDFRMGNVLVGPEGLTAVLDWELAHLGDPMEDLGWFCVRAWRFGNDHLPAGGVGTYDQLVEAYEAAGGAVDRGALLWWELLGTLTWGVMCILQRSAHTSGAVRSVELAAIGRRVCENEWDVLTLLDRAGWPGGLGGDPPAQPELADPARSALHDRPTAAELVEAVREYVERDVFGATEGRVQFHARVATNVLKTIERELRLAEAQEAAHAADLASLGVADERALADAIRTGSLDDRLPEVAAVVRRTVLAKLAVANPGYERPKQGR